MPGAEGKGYRNYQCAFLRYDEQLGGVPSEVCRLETNTQTMQVVEVWPLFIWENSVNFARVYLVIASVSNIVMLTMTC